MKHGWKIGSAALAALAVVALVGATAACGAKETPEVSGGPDVPGIVSHNTEEITWVTDWDGAFERARGEKKVVVVDFYADWCVWCRRLDTTTYRDPEVVRYMSEEVIPVKMDVEARPGKALANKYGVDGLPTIVILSPEGEELGRIPGYLRADDFLATVKKYVES